MVTRRRLLQGAGGLALLAPLANRWAEAAPAKAQTKAGDAYVPVTDAQVRAKLAQWSDWKFGIILHFGLYSELGIIASWTLCSEDLPWIKRPPGVGYVEWKRRYEDLRKTFDPAHFDPAQWADVAHAAGMRYAVFTTKHHDGFNMFDTRQTEYRVTASDVPFHSNPRANVAKAVFDAFRARDFGIGAYFSKADWHQPDYWSPEWATPTRNNNYDVRKHPETWKRFVEFTHRQIHEITSQYGPLDILWLDAGWVGAPAIPDAKAYTSGVPWVQDIDMAGIAAIARRNQPGIIMVNRDEGGPYENYRTPEGHFLEQKVDYPWEAVISMGGTFSWKPHVKYKTPREIVHLLVNIVARGGNLLLGIGPEGDGSLPAAAVERLLAVGKWMEVNGSAIHGSHPFAPYHRGKFCLTQGKDGSVNAIYLTDANEPAMPGSVIVPGVRPTPDARVQILGVSEPLAWASQGDGFRVKLPRDVRLQLAGALAWTIRVSGLRS
ncbi:MAG TPA: alpha-L-fucosidase [Rhodanobacteraceae bacterium]